MEVKTVFCGDCGKESRCIASAVRVACAAPIERYEAVVESKGKEEEEEEGNVEQLIEEEEEVATEKVAKSSGGDVFSLLKQRKIDRERPNDWKGKRSEKKNLLSWNKRRQP